MSEQPDRERRYALNKVSGGSNVNAVFSNGTGTWNATLSVRQSDGSKTRYRKFKVKGPSLPELIQQLDGLFRDWKRKQNGPGVGVPADVIPGREARKTVAVA